MFRPKPKYKRGELLVKNKEGNFGDKNDDLFHVCSRRYGRVNDDFEKRWYYNGVILELKETSSEGLPKVPVYVTGIVNVAEENLKRLEEII